MAVAKPPARFAHIDGHTDVGYDESGRLLLTAGADGDVRVWRGFDDDEATSHRAGDCVYTSLLRGKRLFVAADNNVVQMYTFPDMLPDGIVTRCTGRVTHLTLNAAGTHMAVASSDFDIKYVEIETNVTKLFEGHTAPVLSVAIDPKSEFMASSACDGLVKVWHVATRKPVSNMKLLSTCSDVSLAESLCRMSWSPKAGAFLAVPLKGKIELYQRSSWKKTDELTAEGISDSHFNIVVFSPDGRHVCAATTDGWIVLWSSPAATAGSASHMSSSSAPWSVVKKWKQTKAVAITALAWNPADEARELCFADSQGQFGVIQNVVEAPDHPKPAVAAAQTHKAASSGAAATAKLGGAAVAPGSDDVPGSESSDDDEELAQIRRLRQLVGLTSSQEPTATWTTAAGDADDDFADDDEARSLAGASRPADDGLDRRQTPAAAAAADVQTPSVAKDSRLGHGASAVGKSLSTYSVQSSFKPGSTPVGLQSRFMVWNAIGIVRQYVSGSDSTSASDESSIDVEFHDTSIHHSLHLSNSHGYTMADLSHEALLLASEGDDGDDAGSDGGDRSQLFCMHFGSWDSAKEWAVTMPEGERVEALVLSDAGGWAAVATSRRIVRLFGVSGSQVGTFGIGGPVVALAACGRTLAIAYHRGAGAFGDQCETVEFMDVRGRTLRRLCSRDIPLSPRASLSWLGFTDEGTPVAYDSAGMLRLLSTAMGNVWVEVAHLKSHAKGRSDNFWLVGVSEQSRNARCVLCRGSSFPPTLPRPIITLLPLEMPLCETASEKGQLEERAWQNRFLAGCCSGGFGSSRREGDEARQEHCLREEQATLVKLFAMACKGEREYRALQLCELMPTGRALESAAKYATHLRRADLVRRINELISASEADDARADESTFASLENGPVTSNRLGVQSHNRYSYTPRTSAGNDADDDDDAMQHSSVADADVSLRSSTSLHTAADAADGDSSSSEPKKLLVLTKRPTTATPKSSLSFSQGSQMKNPFKLGPIDTPPSASRGSCVFDSIEKPQLTARTSSAGRRLLASGSKSKASSDVQGRQPGKSKVEVDRPSTPTSVSKPKTAFELWLAENESSIKTEAGDDQDSIMALATDAFQKLSRDEKKKWMTKSKSQVVSVEEPKKRKLEDVENGGSDRPAAAAAAECGDDGCNPPKRLSPDVEGVLQSTAAARKQPLAAGGNAQSKLAAFAFTKQGPS